MTTRTAPAHPRPGTSAGEAGPEPGGPARPSSPRSAARGWWVVPTLLLVAGVALGVAGVLVLVAGPGETGVRTVVVTMRHTRFEPAEIRVDAGTTVRFVVRNGDPIDHEFILGDAAVHARHRVGREAHHDGSVPGEVSVASGATVVTSYRFDHPGRVAYICHLPGHEAYGMVGSVDVR
jgi:uncharacterized cupredoxin-like copper-binding protein